MRGARMAMSQDVAWDEWSERDLVECARSDSAAFAELYRRYWGRVFAYLLSYTGDPDDATELAQQVFVRGFEALPSYEHRGASFVAWLFRIARNSAVDTYRRRRRLIPWDSLPPSTLPPADDDPEDASIRAEDLRRVRALIDRLPARKQELLALRFAADMGTRDIAAVVGRSEPAVRKELFRTIQSLKERLTRGDG